MTLVTTGTVLTVDRNKHVCKTVQQFLLARGIIFYVGIIVKILFHVSGVILGTWTNHQYMSYNNFSRNIPLFHPKGKKGLGKRQTVFEGATASRGLYHPFSITKNDSIEINLFEYCSPDHVYFLVLPQQSSPTDPYCFIYWATRDTLAPAARPIHKINSSNIALPGRTILDLKLLEIENVCIMTQLWIYGEI